LFLSFFQAPTENETLTMWKNTHRATGLILNKANSPNGAPHRTEIQLGSVLLPEGIAALNKQL
jgi:hypothetical protein